MDRMPRFPSLFSYQRINATVLPMLGGIFLFLHLSVPVAVALLSVCAVGLLIWSFFKRGEGRRVLLCFLAGIGLSLLLMGLAGVEQLRLERLCSGSHRVEGYVVANEGKEYDLLSSRLDSKSFRKRIRVRTDASWQVGEKRSLELDLYAPNPKQGRAEGVSLLATLRRDGGVVGESRLYSLVGNVRQTLRREFSRQENGGFLSAILLGDRSALTKGQTAAFRRTASSHILAISGLHISQTVTFLVCFLRLFPIPKRGIRIILFPVVAVLYLLAGAGISVFRASVMTLFSMTALLLRHRGDSTTALTFSAALLVFANPYALESPSFLLSYASTFGMTTCGVPMSEYAEESFREKGIPPMIRLLRYPVLGLVLASVAFVFTTPVQLLLFGTVSPFAPLFSVLLVPLFQIVLILTLLGSFFLPLLPEAASVWLLRFPAMFPDFVEFCALGAPAPVESGTFGTVFAILLLVAIGTAFRKKAPLSAVFVLHGVVFFFFEAFSLLERAIA